MKKILKPLAILGVMACLVGCNSQSTIKYDVSYTEAAGQAYDIIEKFSGMGSSYDVTLGVKEMTCSLTATEEYDLSDGSASEKYDVKLISKLNRNQRAVEYYISEIGYENGVETFNDFENYLFFYDAELGFVCCETNALGTFWGILFSNEAIKEKADAKGKTTDEIVDFYLDSFMWDGGLEMSYSYLGSLGTVSEKEYQESLFKKYIPGAIKYTIGENGYLAVSTKEENIDVGINLDSYIYVGKASGEIDVLFENYLPTKLHVSNSFEGDKINIYNTIVLKVAVEKSVTDISVSHKAKISIPDLDKIPYIEGLMA